MTSRRTCPLTDLRFVSFDDQPCCCVGVWIPDAKDNLLLCVFEVVHEPLGIARQMDTIYCHKKVVKGFYSSTGAWRSFSDLEDPESMCRSPLSRYFWRDCVDHIFQKIGKHGCDCCTRFCVLRIVSHQSDKSQQESPDRSRSQSG